MSISIGGDMRKLVLATMLHVAVLALLGLAVEATAKVTRVEVL